jgi:Mn2+/Fe2+ NRAMP family transporter
MRQRPVTPDPVSIPAPTGPLAEPWSIRKLWRMAGLFGPAAIVASVSIGAGETIVVVQAGAWAGYGLLWLVLASVLVKGVCATYLLGRYSAVSGESLGQRLVRLPGPRGWLLVTIFVLELAAAGPLWAAIARPSGDLMYYLLEQALSKTGIMPVGTSGAVESFPLLGIMPFAWKSLFATGFILAALALGSSLSLKGLEQQQVVICGVLVVGTVVGTLLVWPDFAATIAGSLRIGHVPDVPPWAPDAVRQQSLPLTIATTFGYVGGSVMTYIAYSTWISIHGWGLCGHAQIDAIRRRAGDGSPRDYLPDEPKSAARLRRLVTPLRWDVSIGAAVLFVVSASFMLAGAAVLNPMLQSGQLAGAFSGWSLLTDQGHIWQAIHPALVWVYYVCVLAALWGTLQAYPEIYARVTHEFAAAIWPARNLSYHRLQTWIAVFVFATSVPLVWSRVEFATLTNIVAFLATNGGVALAMLAALWLNFQLPPRYRTRSWMLFAGVLSALILVAASVVSGWELLSEVIRPH